MFLARGCREAEQTQRIRGVQRSRRAAGGLATQELKAPQLSGRMYLMEAISIFGAANAIMRKLTAVGAANLING